MPLDPTDLHLPRTLFVAGGTGYLGRHLLPLLTARKHRVLGLVRPISRLKLDPSAEPVLGSALTGWSYAHRVPPADTFVHLIGAPRRSSAELDWYRDIDLTAVEASLFAARSAGVSHFVFVSVAQTAAVNRSFAKVRAECEALIRESGLRATILRPSIVSGVRRPAALLPFYSALDLLASGAAGRREGLVTLHEMLHALVTAVESPPTLHRIIEAAEIRALSRATERQSAIA